VRLRASSGAGGAGTSAGSAGTARAAARWASTTLKRAIDSSHRCKSRGCPGARPEARASQRVAGVESSDGGEQKAASSSSPAEPAGV